MAEDKDNKKAADSDIVDINSVFERHINLHRIISNKSVVELLKIAAEQYYNDRAIGKNVALPSILFIGNLNSGRKTLARAVSNSYCLEFKETLGMTLCNGGDDNEFFLQGKDCAYFVREADCTIPGTQHEIYRLLCEKQVRVFSPIEHKDKFYPFTGMLIMSVSDPGMLPQPLVNSFDILCHLKGFSRDERFQIVKQRCTLLGWKCPEEVMLSLACIVNVWVMIRTAMMAYRVMRAQCDENISVKHLRKAISLLATS